MYILPVIILYLYVYLGFVVGTTNITTTQFLTDPESLTSNDSTFRIGFFSPFESTSRYVGIWYNIDPQSSTLEVIWVANRDNPLNDSSGMLKISENGDLQVIDGKNTTFWSSNTTATGTVVAQLLDTGNLVLISNPSGLMIWQSFEHPTDSWLPSVKFTVNQETKENPMLRSWKSDSDPSSGSFRFGIVPRTLPEFFTLKGDKPYWRSGPWNGYLYIGIPNMNSEVSTGFNIIDDHEGSLYVAYSVLNRSILERYMMNYDGLVLQKDWDFAAKRWVVKWQSIGSECDVYGNCGAFGICNPTGSPICNCLTGFRPRKVDEWRQGNWSSGCARTAELHCDSTEKKEDVFLRLEHMKVPDYSEWISANDHGDCGNKCLGDCSCLAYAYYSGIGCMIWNRTLIDIQQFSGDGTDLFIRLAHSALSEQSSKWRVIVGVLVITSSAVFVALMYFICRRMKQRRAKEKPNIWHDNMKIAAGGRNGEFGDLPLFNLEKLLTATNDFSEGNKLGQGGFGPVYKGELEDGQQIAVKRLSKASGQGIEEFMNEVVVISKLQHKNLVKLLGCCVDGEEKLLVYEYMPNKSLDSFLFDSRHKEQLDWEKRLNIIKGICRGLLYLHRDSRLRIIHRDLKASNILLDEGLDPKISDFGMARIFDPKQDQARTLRIASTYGYMSPEYAMEGRFSEKSDVYSLGVLLLEIVSGKKNHFLYDETLNLLAYAWKLWNENEMLLFIDQKISDPSCQEEILRCIQLGLLCVQELPHDRPNVSTLLYLLDNNAMVVPDPKQPGFTQTKPCSEDGQECSVNDLTVTAVSSR
ncbi:G-type lectin S-receptor-like serine/threonine-protein kinase At1g11300 isoform X2 [Silene latifolia]|uniref:G-type lectin S-receptor-like serine/threonine-protein kinase At1g11300 isoform X2 n=1 Tax=Silene latifolia TaxID=37657 RepID=UPI003D77D764